MEEITKTLEIQTKTLTLIFDDEYPLTQVQMATLLGDMDEVCVIARQERINPTKILEMVETPRSTYSIYVLDEPSGKKFYIAEKESKNSAISAFDRAVFLAQYGQPGISTFRKTDRSN